MISGTGPDRITRGTSAMSTGLDVDEAMEHLSNQSGSANLMHVTVKRSRTAIPEMASFRLSTKRSDVSPPSREATLPTPLRLKKQATTVKTTEMMFPRFNRSRTVLGTPFRSCGACCIKHLHSAGQFNPDSGNGAHVHSDGIYGDHPSDHTSYLAADTRTRERRGHFRDHGVWLAEKVPLFMFGREPFPERSHGNREELSMALTSTVKKGPIALSYMHVDSNKYFYSESQLGRPRNMPVIPEPEHKQDRQQTKEVELLNPGIKKQIEKVSQHIQEEDERKMQEEKERRTLETNLRQFTLTDLNTVLGQAVVNVRPVSSNRNKVKGKEEN